MPDMVATLIGLERRIVELERRLEATVRVGTVTEIDPEKGLAKVDLGTPSEPLLTAWVPWTERAGAIKTWTPPEPGEQVRLISPTGDIAQGWIDQGGFSNENQQPHNKGRERRMTVGDTTITETGGQVLIQTPDAKIECTTAKVEAETSAVIETKTALVKAERVDLGDEGGPPVSRIGDMVKVQYGSSAGLHPIVQGSSIVNAAG
ncbi:MAG: phage baseplate assembly protein V [Pseudomonadota bacterium]